MIVILTKGILDWVSWVRKDDEFLIKLGATTKGGVKVNKHTGCLLVGNFGNGYVLPSIYFHSDEKMLHIAESTLVKYGLESWQLVYLPDFIDYAGKIPNYIGEQKELVSLGVILWKKNRWMKVGRHIPDIHVITDNGHAWKATKESYMEMLGFKEHHFLPAVGHHYMSTCDNGTNGPAKAIWKALDYRNEVKFTDLPSSTLELLRASQVFKKGYITKCWTRNFHLDIEPEECTFANLQKRFHARGVKWAELSDKCLAEYESFKQKKGFWTHLRTQKFVGKWDTGLNGVYYDGFQFLSSKTKT